MEVLCIFWLTNRGSRGSLATLWFLQNPATICEQLWFPPKEGFTTETNPAANVRIHAGGRPHEFSDVVWSQVRSRLDYLLNCRQLEWKDVYSKNSHDWADFLLEICKEEFYKSLKDAY